MTETTELPSVTGEFVSGPTIGRLAAALAAVQQELPPIRKAETGEVTGTTKDGKPYSYKYSYADLAAVSAAVMPLLGKNGLAFTSWPTNVDGRLVLRYHLLHESGEQMDGEYPLPSGDRVTAQQLGSAITYARRYCLCAVTGVAPDDDDDAAAADGAQAQRRAEQRAEQQAEGDRERQSALDAVKGAWFNQYGEFNSTAAADLFDKWSKGGSVSQATPAQLRAFAGYLHALPVSEAGSTPDTAAEPADARETRGEPEPRQMTGLQRGRIFASMGDMGITERSAQLEWLSNLVGRTLKSRSELTLDDAKVVIDHLEQTQPRTEEGGTR